MSKTETSDVKRPGTKSIKIDSDVRFAKGTAKGRVCIYDGERLIHWDRIDLMIAANRRSFSLTGAKLLTNPDQVDAATVIEETAAQINTRLLEKLAELHEGSNAQEQLKISQIVRPDLFITSQVVGMSAPSFAIVDGKPAGRLRLYLRWSDGRREVRDYSNSIELPDGARLWLYPEPTPPPADFVAGWSATARQAWEAGAEAPDPADVFKRLCEVIARFVDLPAEDAAGITATVALWIMLTYVFQAWDAVPYLYGGGPAGSGKTRLFIEIPTRLARNAIVSSNISASALFRRLNDRGGTLLLDEAERLKEGTPDAAELRSVLLAGYKRGGKATRNERVGDGRFEQIEFDVYGPKTIVCVNGLPPTLASRCIPTIMFRSAADSAKPRRRLDEDSRLWSDLRDDLHAFAMEYGLGLMSVARRTDVCPPMSGRNYELWQPLMALAAWLEEQGILDLLAEVQDHASKVIGLAQEDQTPDTDQTVLELLATQIKAGNVPTPGELLTTARAIESDTFKKWTPRTLSNVLKRYQIITTTSHGIRAYRNVTVEQLARIQQTYGLELGISGSDASPALPDPVEPAAQSMGSAGSAANQHIAVHA